MKRLKTKDLEEGEIYVTIYCQFVRLEHKGKLFHKFRYESNGREWVEWHTVRHIVMTGGEYFNRMYGTYGKDTED
jgi:hypothetical protein